jgi:uncharacterized membrane protein
MSEFRIGQVLGTTWTVFTKNFVLLLAIGIISSLPNLLFGDGTSMRGTVRPEEAWKAGIGVLLWMILIPMGQAAIVYVAFQSLRRQQIHIGEAVQNVLARFWPIIGIILCYVGALLAFAVVGWGLIFAVIMASGGGSAGVILAVLIGIALIVLGSMLVIRWSVVLPACVVERLGPIASLRRSSDLTKGHRWAVFGINLLIFGLLAIVSIVVVGGLTALWMYSAGGVPVPPSGTTFAALQILNLLWNAVWLAYYNSASVMIYHDLRVAKEGIGTDDIAAVFD